MHTLAASLAPPLAPGVGPSGQRSGGELATAALLRNQPWGQAWRDAAEPAFVQAVAATVNCAWQLGHGAQAHTPKRRATY